MELKGAGLRVGVNESELKEVWKEVEFQSVVKWVEMLK